MIISLTLLATSLLRQSKIQLEFWACKHTLLAHVQHFVHQDSEVLFLQHLFHWLLLIYIYFWDCTDLDAIPYICCCWIPLSCHGPTFQACLGPFGWTAPVCKPAQIALNPTIRVVDKEVEKHWSQDRCLKDTSCHRPLPGHSIVIDHQICHAWSASNEAEGMLTVSDHILLLHVP